MEVRCVREALSRPIAYPLLFPPRLSTTWFPTARCYQTDLRRHRYLSTSASFTADRPSTAASSEKPIRATNAQAEVKKVFNQVLDQTPSSSPYNASTTPEKKYMNPKISAKLDELFPPKDNPPPPSATAAYVDNAYRSWADKSQAGLTPGSIAGSMLMPGNKDGSRMGQRVNANLFANHPGQSRRRLKRTIRSSPTVGRTVEVEEKAGVDLGRAFQKLARLISDNHVRDDQYLQKYHERPGLKRKRLKHIRWQRLFKAGFQATVQRAIQMRKQGW